MGVFDRIFGAKKDKPRKAKKDDDAPVASPVTKSCGIVAKSCSTAAPREPPRP